MLHWSACMAAYSAQPPDPAVVGATAGASAWRERVEATEPWVATWLAHQRRDDYWRQGSACERHAEIACPVFAVGGWSDGYRDMVLRMVEHAGGPVRGLIGPWGHTLARGAARPGRRSGSCRRSCASSTARSRAPRTASSTSRALIATCRSGSGRSRAAPSGRGAGSPTPRGRRRTCETRVLALGGAPRASLRGLQLTGSTAGVWCGDGGPADLPGDQRPEDGASLCWDFEPLDERLELLGHVVAELELAADRPARVRRGAAVRRRARRQLLADRARRAQPHPPRGPRPRLAAGARASR